MKFNEVSNNLEYNKKILAHTGSRSFPKKLQSLTEEERQHLIDEIKYYYFKREWGLKLLARNVLGLTYTKCRTLFSFLNIQYRTGTDVTTKTMLEFRKQKAYSEREEGIGFNSSGVKRYAKTTSRGVQGYYYNRSTDSYVWLRSTYEFIYAKFLNKIGINWKTEQNVYELSDGTNYRPDFFIYDENWNLEKIVEIKGFWDNRAYKPSLLREQYFKDTQVDIVLIFDIKLYIAENLTYGMELETWKQIRKSKEQKLKE